MRPIMLDLHGFASFRDEAHVDFGDADFFALVGPTGSGKSTVIDAMTFALYGSVPRWGRKGMVSLALAPTVARGTVKLVFEVDRQRYVVARELRRTGGTVSQRAASLERLADPRGLARPATRPSRWPRTSTASTTPSRSCSACRYEDFVQCVVLPQGQFADFLHAKPAERQDILLRLLGAEHYRLMMAKANQRASVAAQRASTYGEELLGYADATPEAEQARARRRGRARQPRRPGDGRPAADRRQAGRAEGRRRPAAAAAGGGGDLSALRVPDGTGTLDADLTAARAGLEARKAAELGAEDADGAARAALAAGPARAPLELARAHRAEHARHQAAVPGLAADVAEHGTRSAAAAAAVGTAAAALDEARADRDQASRAAEAAAERVAALAAEHARLARGVGPRRGHRTRRAARGRRGRGHRRRRDAGGSRAGRHRGPGGAGRRRAGGRARPGAPRPRRPADSPGRARTRGAGGPAGRRRTGRGRRRPVRGRAGTARAPGGAGRGPARPRRRRPAAAPGRGGTVPGVRADRRDPPRPAARPRGRRRPGTA